MSSQSTQMIGFRNASDSPVAASPSNPLPTQSNGYTPALTFGRPTNTTAYTAGDVIGIDNAGSAGSAIHALALAGPTAGGQMWITGADLIIALSAVPSGMTSFRLHLYDVAPTAILDNAAWDLPAGDRASYLGYIDLGTVLDVGSTLQVQSDQINKKIKLLSSTLYAQLVTNGGYTPASGTSFQLRLQTVQV